MGLGFSLGVTRGLLSRGRSDIDKVDCLTLRVLTGIEQTRWESPSCGFLDYKIAVVSLEVSWRTGLAI